MEHEVNVIRARREELGLSQEQLARQAGVGRISVQRAERGEASTETVSKIAGALNVPVNDLQSAFSIQNRLPLLQSIFRKRELTGDELKGLPPDLRIAFEKCHKARIDLLLRALDLSSEDERLHDMVVKRSKWAECAAAVFLSSNEVTRANLLCATEGLRKLPKASEHVAAAPSFCEAYMKHTAARKLLEIVLIKYGNSESNEEALPLGQRLLHPIRILRELRGYSQDGVAQIAGTGRATVQRFEKGGNVAAETQLKILEALEVSRSELEQILKMYVEAAPSFKSHSTNEPSLDELYNLPPALRTGWKGLLKLRAELEDGMARFSEAQEGLNAKWDEHFAAMSHFMECVGTAILDDPNDDTFNGFVRAKDAMCTSPNDGLAAHIAATNVIRDRFFGLMAHYAEAVAAMEYWLTGNVSLIGFASSPTGGGTRMPSRYWRASTR